MKQKEFHQWMKDQIRQVGEELIRRADQISFEGWDMVTDISIKCTIPTYRDVIEAPAIVFSFGCANKVTIDELINGGYRPESILCEDHDHDVTELEGNDESHC